MKKLALLTAALAALVLGGLHWGAKAAPPSDAEPAISLDQSAPALGDTVTFTTTVPKLKGNEQALIVVTCYQGDALVWSWLDTPDAGFVLGSASSPWLQVGGPAECRADLDSYKTSPGPDEITVLATTVFHADG